MTKSDRNQTTCIIMLDSAPSFGRHNSFMSGILLTDKFQLDSTYSAGNLHGNYCDHFS